MGALVTDDVYRPSHLSPSQFTLYALCPLLYRERYVLNIFPPPEPERLFGIAVHAGLEALFKGEDEERRFLQAWREHAANFPRDKYPMIDALRGRGLDVLGQVRGLGLHGEPERQVILTAPGFILPIFGFVDLWCDGLIVDFKTAGFGWTQARADNQLFQPAVYSQAYLERHGRLPRFEFVVLPRIPAPLQVFDATRSPDQIAHAFDKALEIHVAIEDQQWDCTCDGRYHLFDPTDYDE